MLAERTCFVDIKNIIHRKIVKSPSTQNGANKHNSSDETEYTLQSRDDVK